LKLILTAALAGMMALASAAAAQQTPYEKYRSDQQRIEQQRIDAQRTLDQTRTTDRARHDRIDRLRNEEQRAGHPSTHGDMTQMGTVRHRAVVTRHHRRHQVCVVRHHHRVCHWA
jgi:hypothetical protein